MASSFFRWIYNVFASFIGVVFRKLFCSHVVKDDEIEIISSSSSRRYDVFASFRGEEVRKSIFSHLLKALDRKSINTFRDHGIERSLQIAPELLSTIRESRIAIVIFSTNYASSTWCLNELVKIHECYKKLDQMVIPVFYDVEPSHVRNQAGEFGKVFKETCKGKTKDQKQRWRQALADVADMAGEDLQNWPDEAAMIEKIAFDVLNKLVSTPTDDFGSFVGIRAHLEAVNSMLCLESEDARMVGVLGTSGIGKNTIARALFSQHSSKYHYRAFITFKRTIPDDYGMKLYWEKKFLSKILGQEDLQIYHLGTVERRLKHKKVFIVLDDVDDLELLKTLVGQTGWFGSGSRIIVITQDRQLLKAHKIDLIYKVEFPSTDLALKMLCRSAFEQDSPPRDFMEVTVKVAELAGNLPLGLSILGSSLRGREKKEWMEMLPELQNGLDEKIEKILRGSYDRLDKKCQELFIYIAFACLFNGAQVSYIKDLLEDRLSVRLTMLADKSFIRITSPYETIEMHNLLQKLGRKIVHAESIDNPGKRRFLVDAEDIVDVFTHNTGTETLVGIYFNTSDINEPLFIYEKSFEGMRNLQFLIVCDYGWGRKNEARLYLPEGLVYLPRKLRLLFWNNCPLKCFPSNFKAEFLVELAMEDSKLEKLWEGTLALGSLKKINMRNSRYLKEIPDLSNARNLEKLYLFGCKSLLTLHSSIQYVTKLRRLNMGECTKLENVPTHVNLESLKSLEYLNLRGCFRLRNFPQISLYNSTGFFWSELISTISYLEQASSSSPSRRYNVFTSFHGPDVRRELLGHLLKEFNRKSITSFKDQEIVSSHTISASLSSAFRESRISIVIFSDNYASSSWCLDELVAIHESYKTLDLMVIPIFYNVDPSEVRKQTRGFGKVFEKTCEGRPEDQKQRWMQALTDIANVTGENSQNWCDEATMVREIADDVSNKILTPSNCFDKLIGLEAHKGNEFNIRKGRW
ncbi:PREDICTED: protein SUPPRESSOR OF npr1-1, CONSTITUTIVE 1-like [Camelina sativa]|uniref:Protein SUPPRESSOR OF npr1-1, CONSTITUTIVE 1-like n=1 Tax=Camelina sativa TaxID=90675 RepID=A0ABM0UER3_CAMSA|nr:PREDICTED: protein SUPPRESSOR OF npr1-1, CONSTITUTIVE 1-like [Camelina sativa]